jgi:site-specific recombinase XerD
MPRKSLPPAAGRPLSAVIRSWILALKDAHRAHRTITLYQGEGNKLVAFLGDIPVDKVTAADMRRYRDALIEKGLADTSRNMAHRALNVLFNFAVNEGDLEVSPMARLKAPTIDSEKTRRFHVPTDAELDRVFAEIAKDDHPHTRARDTAILRLFMDTGMRLGELTSMQVDDVDLDQRMAHIAGKTGYRSVRFSPKTARALDRYLTQRARHYARDSKALWLARAGAMTNSGIGQMVKDRARAAGISRLHPHALRHRFANAWLEAGGNEIDLQWLAGWRSGAMVRRYSDYAGSDRALKAYDRVPNMTSAEVRREAERIQSVLDSLAFEDEARAAFEAQAAEDERQQAITAERRREAYNDAASIVRGSHPGWDADSVQREADRLVAENESAIAALNLRDALAEG